MSLKTCSSPMNQFQQNYQLPIDSKCAYIHTEVVHLNSNQMINNRVEDIKNNEENQQVGRQCSEQERESSSNQIQNELPQIQTTQYLKNNYQSVSFSKQNEENVIFVNEFCHLTQQEKELQLSSNKVQNLVDIKEIVEDKQNNQNNLECQYTNQQYTYKQQNDHKQVQSIKQDDENACRICLDADSSPESGELLNICECKGSLKYIHKYCLWMQLSSKVKLDEFERNEQQFKCELCKTPYRLQIGVKYVFHSFEKFKINILDILKPIIIFICFTICSTIMSFFLIDFISNQGAAERRSSIGFMYYMFVSFASTMAFISFIVLIYLIFKSALQRKVSLLQIFQKKEDFQNYQNRSSSRSRTTSATIQQQEFIPIQNNVIPQNNEMNL